MDRAQRRLALGTVRFGQEYGIASQAGQVPRSDIVSILTRARSAGLDTIDTCVTYGDAEQRLGEIDIDGFRVVSKFPALSPDAFNVARLVEEVVLGSLARLRIPRLHGVLVRRSSDLLGPHGQALYGSLLELKARGCVARLGVSIYSPAELEALEGHVTLDLVQAPFNVLDRRLLTSGWLERLTKAGIEVHARSVYLQGLLALPESARPARFDRWQPLLRRWDAWLADSGLRAPEACLRFALSVDALDRVIVGIDNPGQFEEALTASAAGPLAVPRELAIEDVDLIDPTRWTAH
jgi:aryl-alcohol dehydrogenase-like predicted oxidoreductase